MQTETSDASLQAESAFRQIACLYARAMDRAEPELLDGIATDDLILEGPGFTSHGLDKARGFPAMLRQMFLMTQHVVHNQTITITGDEAEGETYCTASHISHPAAAGEGHTALVWAVRYQDKFRRENGKWLLSQRALIVDWSETRPVTLGTGQ